jgi:hypothetical protein
MKNDKYAALTDKQLEQKLQIASPQERAEIRAELATRFKEAYVNPPAPSPAQAPRQMKQQKTASASSSPPAPSAAQAPRQMEQQKTASASSSSTITQKMPVESGCTGWLIIIGIIGVLLWFFG